MSNAYPTQDSEQNVLNDAKDDTYGTLDVTPYVETTPGSVAARVSGSTRGGKTVASVEIVDAAGDQITTFGAAGGATETTLAAIKSTDGIKKITDALPAGTNLLGGIAASAETGTVYQGTTARTPVSALANIAASQTDSSIVSALGGSNKIRVLALAMVAGATATNITFNTKPAGAGTAISPLFANAANGGAVLPFNPAGWFTTGANEGLTATTGAGSTTGILVTYILVT